MMKFPLSAQDDNLTAIPRRLETLERWLKDNAPECIAEQKHLDEGTPERAYWHYGYLVALRDVLNLMKRAS